MTEWKEKNEARRAARRGTKEEQDARKLRRMLGGAFGNLTDYKSLTAEDLSVGTSKSKYLSQ